MKSTIIIEYWDWPIFTAEPCGFGYIEVRINDPSQAIDIKATISLEDARSFGERLINLVENFDKA